MPDILATSVNTGIEVAKDVLVSPKSTKWQRPEAWGEYPSEFQAEKAKQDAQRTMEAIYLLYHHDEEKYGSISSFAGFKCTITGGYTVERGHMVGSTFTVDNTTSVASNTFYTESFTSAMPEYILYRITPATSGNTFSAFVFGHTDADLNVVNQIMIESYGRTHIGRISSLKNKMTIHVDVIAYGTINSMANMFANCTNLESVDCSGWDTSATTTMTAAFASCSSLVSVDCGGWDTSHVTNMQSMFGSCSQLISLDCGSWNTGSVANMVSTFSSCISLKSIDCGNWDLHSVTNIQNIFSGCASLQEIDCSNWTTSINRVMNNIFSYCVSLTKLDLNGWNVSNCANFSRLFDSCSSLTILDLSGWDTSSVTDNTNMFNNCPTLIQFNSCPFYKSVSLSSATHLSHDSLISIINNLATVTTTQTLTIGATNLAKLTAEERAIATNKGWTLA